jgi:hypothetical protein
VRSIATDFFFKKKTADLAASIAGAAVAHADAGHARVRYVYSVGCNFIKVSRNLRARLLLYLIYGATLS